MTVPEYRDAGCGGNAPPFPTRTKPNLPNSPTKITCEQSSRPKSRIARAFALSDSAAFVRIAGGCVQMTDDRTARLLGEVRMLRARVSCTARGAALTPTVTHRLATALPGSKDQDKDGVAPGSGSGTPERGALWWGAAYTDTVYG